VYTVATCTVAMYTLLLCIHCSIESSQQGEDNDQLARLDPLRVEHADLQVKATQQNILSCRYTTI